jgi:GxxExxY protein
LVHEIHEKRERESGSIVLKDESFRVLGACFQVYKAKGCGFQEAVYQECLRIELSLQQIPFLEKPTIELEYKGVKLSSTYVPDFICFGSIIVELKALPKLLKENDAQLLNYLRATGKPLGILANFGHYPLLEHRRITAHDSWLRADQDEVASPDLLA